MQIQKKLLALFKTVLFIYLLVLTSMFFLQEKLLFHPTKTPLDFKYHFVNPYDEKFLSVDGLKIHSLHFKSQNPKGVILYFHGNGCELRQCGFIADELTSKLNYDVWIFDYPGYGKSEGYIKNEQQLHQIANAVFEELKTRVQSKDIVLFGRSLGSGIATKLASENSVKALILETPYFSIKDLALSNYPFVPAFLLKYNFRSDLYAPQIKVPTLIFHGDKDSLIPIEQSKRLSKLLMDLKYIEIAKGTHDDLSLFPEYWSQLELFITNLK